MYKHAHTRARSYAPRRVEGVNIRWVMTQIFGVLLCSGIVNVSIYGIFLRANWIFIDDHRPMRCLYFDSQRFRNSWMLDSLVQLEIWRRCKGLATQPKIVGVRGGEKERESKRCSVSSYNSTNAHGKIEWKPRVKNIVVDCSFADFIRVPGVQEFMFACEHWTYWKFEFVGICHIVIHLVSMNMCSLACPSAARVDFKSKKLNETNVNFIAEKEVKFWRGTVSASYVCA